MPVTEVEEEVDDRPVRRFRLKAGLHTEKGPTRNAGPQWYKAGDVVESQSDLVALHGAEKFEELGTGKPKVQRPQTKVTKEFLELPPEERLPGQEPTDVDEDDVFEEVDEVTGEPKSPKAKDAQTPRPGVSSKPKAGGSKPKK